MRITLAIILAMIWTGCQTVRKGTGTAIAPVLNAQVAKDEKILGAANVIDTVTAPTAVAQEVKAQTNVIREAVKEAPAQAVAVLTKSLEDRAAKAEKRALEAEDSFNRYVRLGLIGIGFFLAAITVAGGLMFAKFAVLFSWFGRDVLILTGSLSLLAWFSSIAYGWAIRYQNYLMGGAALILLAIGILIYSNIRHEKLDRAP